MGKHKKGKGPKHIPGDVSRDASLAEQIIDSKVVRPSGRTKARRTDEVDDEFIDDKLSRRILQQARLQQEELQEEYGVSKAQKSQTVSLGGGGGAHSDSDDAASGDEAEGDYGDAPVEVDEEDERALEMFMSQKAPLKRTLADIIQEKLTEKQTEIASQLSDNASLQLQQIDERVLKMYKSIRDILARYRSGKLPKAFKIVPNLSNWEQILYITEPDKWSAAAMYQATRIFTSNLKGNMAQRFFNLVLLPRIRDDIAEYKRLNFHLYMAMKKALFKPASFFKGLLLPICESGTCTLREAIIVSSVLAKHSIPMLHSAAAILKIAEMEYNGATSIFLRTLLDKKYALPYRVVDAVVYHFIKFQLDKRTLPVLWHQCLLTFTQRYKGDISSEQKDALLDLLKVHVHSGITPEVRRELVHSKCRDDECGTSTRMEGEDL